MGVMREQGQPLPSGCHLDTHTLKRTHVRTPHILLSNLNCGLFRGEDCIISKNVNFKHIIEYVSPPYNFHDIEYGQYASFYQVNICLRL